MDSMQVVELIAKGLELIGVAVIAFAFLHALIRSALYFWRRRPDAYDRVKTYIGKALMLGLEFLVAADIIRTVTVKPTLEGLESLGLLVILRIVLGWSIAVEIDGCWPWLVSKKNKE